MLASSAFLSNVPVVIWDGGEAPTKQILALTTPNLAHIDSLFKNPAKFRELASKQEKFRHYVHLQPHALPIAPFLDVAEPAIYVTKDAACVSYSQLKSENLAYDGFGNLSSVTYRRLKTSSNSSAGAPYMRRSGRFWSRRLLSLSCALPYLPSFEAPITNLQRTLKI